MRKTDIKSPSFKLSIIRLYAYTLYASKAKRTDMFHIFRGTYTEVPARVMPNILEVLSTFPQTCIYVLVDEENNAALHWSYCSGVSHLAELITELRKNIYDYKVIQNAFNRGTLRLEILKEYGSPVDLAILRCEATRLFQATGYIDVSGKFQNVIYKINTLVMPDYRNFDRITPLVYVTLKSKSPKSIVLGIFDNMVEADEWITAVDPGHTVTLWFASNSLTEEYHAKHGYELIRFREKL